MSVFSKIGISIFKKKILPKFQKKFWNMVVRPTFWYELFSVAFKDIREEVKDDISISDKAISKISTKLSKKAVNLFSDMKESIKSSEQSENKLANDLMNVIKTHWR